ncbi:MAG: ATP-binding domain-containing protein, partial [bacterium]
YMMLQRNLLYTGLTRAKKLAVFIGTSWAIKRAVSNKHVQPRYTRLSLRLQSLVEDLGRLGVTKRQGEAESGNAKSISGNGVAPTLPGRLF